MSTKEDEVDLSVKEKDGDSAVSVIKESPSSVTLNSSRAVVKLGVKVNGNKDPFKDIFAAMEKLRAEQKEFMENMLLKQARPVNVTSHTQFSVSYHPVNTQLSSRKLRSLPQLDSPEDDVNFDISEDERTSDTIKKQWKENSDQFLEMLESDIKNINRHMYALRRLKSIQDQMETEDDVLKYRNKVYTFYSKERGQKTLLDLAANYECPEREYNLIGIILDLFPDLVCQRGRNKTACPTVLHRLVLNRNLRGTNCVFETAKEKGQVGYLLSVQVIDEKYKITRLMGEKALFIAALSFDYEMVEFLIGKGAKVSTIVSGGNTVFHLLVKYADLYPEHQTDAQNMMEKLNKDLQNEEMVDKSSQTKEIANNEGKRQISLWHKANDEGQTVLQLAALLGQHELFKWILQLKDIYLKHYKDDDLIDYVRFDVNEIDYVALNHFRISNPGNQRQGNSNPGNKVKGNSKPGIRTNVVSPVCTNPNRVPSPASRSQNSSRSPQSLHSSSVTEIICEKLKTEKALQFIDISLFDVIWKKKWDTYCVWFYCWLALHLVIMALVIAQAVIKANLINGNQQLLSTTQATLFVYIVSVLLFAIGVLYIVLEFVSVHHHCMPRVLIVPRNGDYHGLLVVLSLCLMADAIWVWVQGPQNNYLLAIALVVGGWFFTFFLRPTKIFSVFTTIVRRALLGDGLRFAVIILFDFVAFSLAMYIMYLTTPGGPPAEFEHLGISVLTMFKLMIGVDDLEILTRAPSPWLTVTLFIIFVVLTYILMFNILTAIMTETTKEISEKGELQWKLQRLAVVVMIEKMLPLCWACNSAEGRDENTQRFLSTYFYHEKDAQRIFQERNKQLLKDNNTGDNSKMNTSGVPGETSSEASSHGTSPFD